MRTAERARGRDGAAHADDRQKQDQLHRGWAVRGAVCGGREWEREEGEGRGRGVSVRAATTRRRGKNKKQTKKRDGRNKSARQGSAHAHRRRTADAPQRTHSTHRAHTAHTDTGTPTIGDAPGWARERLLSALLECPAAGMSRERDLWRPRLIGQGGRCWRQGGPHKTAVGAHSRSSSQTWLPARPCLLLRRSAAFLSPSAPLCPCVALPFFGGGSMPAWRRRDRSALI